MTTAIPENATDNPRCAEFVLSEEMPETARAAVIVDLLDRMASASEPSAAYATLIRELERDLGSRAVLLGLVSSQQVDCQWAAATMHWNAPERAAIEDAMAECLARGESGIWPADENSSRHALRAHAALASLTNAGCVLTVPLSDRKGRLQGVLMVLGENGSLLDFIARQFLQAAAQPVASAISLVRKNRPSRWRRWIGRMGEHVGSQKFVAALLCLIVAGGVMCIPLPYRIACQCQLEPVTRRFVAAPFDGTLERSVVEPGDLVTEGQRLAVMDGREIRWELAGLVAEQSQAGKERDGHMAKHDFGAAQVAKLEMERLRLREQLLAKRSENLEIRSPIAGIVVVGDLKKSEGVPLAVGEQLFEIAPLDRMVVEIAIPEEDIPWTVAGQAVEIVLDAYPESTWTGTLSRIHPRAELRDEEHIFVGEVILENPNAVLRPGMRGRAKIEGPRKPLGWNLFHKPWNEARYWLGW